jgi:hypothetical protein
MGEIKVDSNDGEDEEEEDVNEAEDADDADEDECVEEDPDDAEFFHFYQDWFDVDGRVVLSGAHRYAGAKRARGARALI